MMKATVPSFIASMFLLLCPVRAMINDYQEEGRLNTAHANLFHQSSPRKETSSLVSTVDFPDDLLLSVFNLIDVDDLGRVAQVSILWRKVTKNPYLWKYTGSKYYGDYLSGEDLRENPREKVISHYLSVVVNAAESLEDIERLVIYYQLNLFSPLFRKYVRPITNVGIIERLNDYYYFSPLLFEEFIAQDNNEVIEGQMQYLYSPNAYRMGVNDSYKQAREWNDRLVARRNSRAIERKILGLTSEEISAPVFQGYCHTTIPYGKVPLYGYKKNILEAREFIEILIKEENSVASERKIQGCIEGKYGYDKDPVVGRELNEVLVERGDRKVIERKIEGLTEGKYGYEKDPVAAREYNDSLVEKGDSQAIERKVEGLYQGRYGYEKNLLAAWEFNEILAKKDNLEAIRRKMEGFLYGAFGYEKNPLAAWEFNEFLVEKGDMEAIKRKIDGLSDGGHGYKRNLDALRECNELLIEKDDLEAIERKIEGLCKGGDLKSKGYGAYQGSFDVYFFSYGYKKDPVAAIEFNDSLVEKGNLQAIKRKIEGLAEGKYGYKKDSSATRELIESFLASDFPVARAMGKYIKAFAMKYGVTKLGYEKDRENAIRFIKENYVPY